MEKDEKIEINGIDKKGYYEQRREDVLKNGKYAKAEIIIEKNSQMPLSNIELNKCGPIEISKLYVTMKGMIEYLEENYMEECLVGKLLFGLEDMGHEITEIEDKEGNK